MITSDFHIHSEFSSDSDSPIESMIESAIQKGLHYICFTDHQDFAYQPNKDTPHLTFQLDGDKYFETMLQYKEQYKNKIEIGIGIEFGLNVSYEREIITMATKYPFDFIIGSSHDAHGLDPYNKSYFKMFDEKEGLRIYFESIVENSKIFHIFQSYGHLDYAARYLPSGYDFYKPEEYFDILDKAMKQLIENGKGIECNTSGLKYGLGSPHPNIKLLKRYFELGGEILTIGSDAHKPEHLAYEFTTIAELLKSIGFRYYTIFRKQKAEFIKL